MVSAADRRPFGEEEAAAFALKVGEWAEALTPREAWHLLRILQLAAVAPEEDARGYGFAKEIAAMEARLASAGDAQLANTDLQAMLTRQQQTLQAMNSISQMIYSTTQSVIRKMGV